LILTNNHIYKILTACETNLIIFTYVMTYNK